MLKDNTLTNLDILSIAHELGIMFNGVYSKDKIPLPLVKGGYIINMQDSNKGDGTHWTAFYYNPSGMSYYFDSFGFPPPEIVNDNIKPFDFNNKQIQDLNSSACGYYCLGFLKMMYSSKNLELNFKKYINMFSDNCRVNDTIILKYVN